MTSKKKGIETTKEFKALMELCDKTKIPIIVANSDSPLKSTYVKDITENLHSIHINHSGRSTFMVLLHRMFEQLRALNMSDLDILAELSRIDRAHVGADDINEN